MQGVNNPSVRGPVSASEPRPKGAVLFLLFATLCRATDIDVGFQWVTDADVDRIVAAKDVQKLDLSLSLISDAGMEKLKALENVTDLNLFAVEHITDVAVAYIRGWKKLERLNLRGTDITDTSLQYLAGVTTLKSLDISDTQVTNNGMEYIASLRNLEELLVGGNKVTGAGLRVLKTLPNLKRLSLRGAQKRNSGTWAVTLTDLDLEMLATLKPLRFVDLSRMKLSAAAVENFRRARPDVEVLWK